MTKTKKQTNYSAPQSLEDDVMSKITSGQIKMKPRWFFVTGSIAMMVGLTSLTISAIFLVNLTLFLVRKRGPGYIRLELMLTTFPWWVPVLALLGILLGIMLLRKYDFSYQKNFRLIIVAFISAILLAAVAINIMGLNDSWARSGPTRRLYQQFRLDGHPAQMPRYRQR